MNCLRLDTMNHVQRAAFARALFGNVALPRWAVLLVIVNAWRKGCVRRACGAYVQSGAAAWGAVVVSITKTSTERV